MKRKNSLWLAVFASVALIAGVMLYLSDLKVSRAEMVDYLNVGHSVEFPYRGEAPDGAECTFKLHIDKRFYHQKWVRIIPDDAVLSINVNGQNLPLDTLQSGSLSDWANGFVYPIGDDLSPGENMVQIVVKNGGGSFGLTIVPANFGFYKLFLYGLFLAAFFAFLFLLLERFGMDRRLILLFLGGFLVRLVYLNVTPWDLRSHDVESHVQYIEYIVRNFALPDRNAGFVFYHPPLYYLISAGVYHVLQLFTGGNSALVYGGLQVFSLLLNMGFLLAGVGILQISLNGLKKRFSREMPVSGFTLRRPKLFQDDLLLIVSASLLIFWPSNIIHSVRIGNDILLYLFYALTVFYLLRWDRDRAPKNLYLSGLFAALSVVTKTNAVLLWGLIGVVLLIDFFRDRFRPSFWKDWLKKCWPLALMFLVCVGLALGGNIAAKIRNPSANLLVGNVAGSYGDLAVGNQPHNYLYFDLKTYLTEPFTSAWSDNLGRQYYWNYLFKTALVGEFDYPHPLTKALAEILSALFLAMLAFGLSGLFMMDRKNKALHRVQLLNFLILAVAGVVFRISIPASCSNDFRYILPVLIPFAFLYVYSAQAIRARGWKRLASFGLFLAAFFCAVSAAFVFSLL